MDSFSKHRTDKVAAILSWSDMAALVQALAHADASLKEASLPVRTKLDLGPRGTMILNQIASGRVHPSTIAAALTVSKSLISSEISRIESAGLASRKPGKDRRHSELALTEKGLEAMAEVKGNLEKLIQERLGHYTKAELNFCTKLLSDLRTSTPIKS